MVLVVLAVTPVVSQESDVAPPVLSVEASEVSDGSWLLQWESVENATSYVVQESAGGAWGTVYTGASLSHEISGKTVSGDYYYRVSACKTSSDCTAYSSAVRVRLEYILPSTLDIPSISESGTYTVRWEADSTQIVTLQRKPSSSDIWDFICVSSRDTNCSEDPDLSSNSIKYSKIETSIGPDHYNYRLMREYTFYICNQQDDGECTNSNTTDRTATDETAEEIVGRETGIIETEAAVGIEVLPPDTPASLTVPESAESDVQFTLQWSAVDYADEYEVQRSRDGGGFVTIYPIRPNLGTNKTLRDLCAKRANIDQTLRCY